MHHDYVVIGSGMAGLTVAALLANAGKSVGLIEAHAVPGGYAHTFSRDGYDFCAHVHYIWGCGPGQKLYQVLEHLNLQNDITFEQLAADGYDYAVLPDGKRIAIPYGFAQLQSNIAQVYPAYEKQLERFLTIVSKLYQEIQKVPHHIRWWHYITVGTRCLTLLKYKNKTLQDVFDECQLPQEIQAILCADAGDFGAPPNRLSILAYTSLFAGYNEGAYYPTKHFKYFTQRLAQLIEEKPNCAIYYNTKVTDFVKQGKKISAVICEDGRRFTANTFICNMDPQKAAHLIHDETLTDKQKSALDYEYSPSAFMIYCGVKGLDLRDYGFGNFNIWHQQQWDMNQAWQECIAGNFAQPWLFLSTPSLKSPDPTSTPEGGQTLEVGLITGYQFFADLYRASPEKYHEKKLALAEHLLDIVEEHYVPNLRQYLEVKEIGTPLSNERFVLSPYGNCYGSDLTPENMDLTRLTSKSPWENLYWCNASGGYPGVYGTVTTAAYLYSDLTGDSVIS